MARPKGPAKEAKDLGGRPTDYRAEFCQEAFRLCEAGATDVELADNFDVSVRTYYRWLHHHPEFRQACQLGKEAADSRVEASVYHRAVGYTHDAVKIFLHEGSPVVVPYREHVPPDMGAARYWLGNRQPKKWREPKQAVEMGADDVFIKLLQRVSKKAE